VRLIDFILKRYLITTADEKTWKFDRPVIFLGEWCRLFDRKHVLKEMDFTVALPYGLGQAKKDYDFLTARELEAKLFPVFYALLNKHHSLQHSERFWRIVLGSWFRRFVTVLVNRVNTLKLCLKEYKISGTAVYKSSHYGLATLDSYSAIFAFNDDRWNNQLTLRILSLLETVNFPIDYLSEGTETIALQGFRLMPSVEKKTLKKKVIESVLYCLSKITRCFMRDKDAFVINSYLPIKKEIKLELAMGQCPQIWTKTNFEIVQKPDLLLRENLTGQFAIKSKDNLENIMTTLLFELLPVCYLEGFADLYKTVNKQPWPKSPKFIFTSINYDTDEVFKLWTAIKVNSGSKYFVGQHGNKFGTHRYNVSSIEEITTDRFITWGWYDDLSKHLPAFIFQLVGTKMQNYNPYGGLLLIELCLNYRIATWDETYEFVDYFNDQISLIRRLNTNPRQNLTLRLHSASKLNRWYEEVRWKAFDPKLIIDRGETDIKYLMAGSRLVVHSYDSTGILETLSQNIPTLAFWQNGFEHLQESAKPYYKLLVKVGILHLTAESVALKINEVWNNVDEWWAQKDIQQARQIFCNSYARRNKKPLSALVKMIESV